MHSDDSDPDAFDFKIGSRSPTRFQGRKIKRLSVENFEGSAHKQCIAVPTEAAWTPGDIHRSPGCIIKRGTAEYAGALSNPAIHLLQSNDVSVGLPQNGDNAVRIAATISANGFVDIVAGKFEPHFARQPSDSPAM